MDYLRLGQRIRKQRKLMGMTQKDVAEKVGISLPFYGHIERGTRKATFCAVIIVHENVFDCKPPSQAPRPFPHGRRKLPHAQRRGTSPVPRPCIG